MAYSSVVGATPSALTTLLDTAKDAVYGLTSCFCSPTQAPLKINGRSFKVLKLLGEGGFSFVYLAQDSDSGRQFALKKIRCPYGSQELAEAMKEVEAYRRFRHPNIIRCIDSAVVQDREGDGKIIYLFLPFYKRGNVQDAINSHSLSNTSFPEREMLLLFHGTCDAVKAMHHYRLPGGGVRAHAGSRHRGPSSSAAGASAEEGGERDSAGKDAVEKDYPNGNGNETENGREEDEVPLMTAHPERVPSPSYPPKPRADRSSAMEGEDGDEVVQSALGEDGEGTEAGRKGAMVPYAHRDIKPGNVMIADDGHPVLMDFGSAIRARMNVRTRAEALAQQDMAAERSTMPYRAPELFDVKTDTILDEKVDIWSLGATLFAMAYHHSPFETQQIVEQGGSLAMAVLNGSYRFPASDHYSEGTREIIKRCLVVDPKQRADIEEVIELTDKAIRSVS